MDTPSADTLQNQLILFEQSVHETARHLAQSSDPASWHASAPFSEKCRIWDLLDSSNVGKEEKASLEEEYCRIVHELDVLVTRQGQGYRDLLLVDLRDMVHAYHAETCFSSLCCDPRSADSLRFRRMVIGELMEQLGSYYPLTALEALVAVVEENARVPGKVMPSNVVVPEDYLSCRPPSECCPGTSQYGYTGKRPSARHV